MPIHSINGTPVEVGVMSSEPFVWEVGSINTSGVDASSTTRIRTIGRASQPEGTNVKFWCDDGYKYALCIYEDGISYYKSDYWHANISDQGFGPKGFTFRDGVELRLTLAKVDDSTMTVDDASALHMAVYPPNRLDVTHGNWTMGAISRTGADTARSTFANCNRSTDFYRFDCDSIELELADGYAMRYYTYETNRSFVERSEQLQAGTHVIDVSPTCMYRFQVSHGTDQTAVLKVEDADNALVVRTISGGGAEPVTEWSDEDERLVQQVRYSSVYSGSSSTVADTLTLLHFSDIHGDADRTERVLTFAADHEDAVDDIIFTGDLLEARWNDDEEWWYEVGADNVLVTLGNHDYLHNGGDWNDIDDYATMSEAYARYFDGFSGWGAVSGGTSKTYWYKDYTDKGVRLFGLDLVRSGVLERDGSSYDADQYDWFVLNLANAKRAGLAVIVAEHFPVNNRVPVSGVGAWYDHDYNYNNRTQWLIADRWHNAIDDFVEAGGEFVCWLSGHTHADLVCVNSNYPSQLVLEIDTATPNKSRPYSDTARAIDTPTQDCFDLIGVDTRSKTLRVVRIGASENQYMQRKKALCLNYLTGEVKGAI